jgi:hypothetical protein
MWHSVWWHILVKIYLTYQQILLHNYFSFCFLDNKSKVRWILQNWWTLFLFNQLSASEGLYWNYWWFYNTLSVLIMKEKCPRSARLYAAVVMWHSAALLWTTALISMRSKSTKLWIGLVLVQVGYPNGSSNLSLLSYNLRWKYLRKS